MNKILILALGVFLISFSLAYYPGDIINVTNELNSTNLVYTIIDNITEINLEINATNEYISFQIPYDLAPQSFEVVFVPREVEKIIETQTVTVHSGGGGGGTRVVTKEVNNTIYLNNTEYVPVEKDCPECLIEKKDLELPEIEESKLLWRYYVIAGILFLIFLFVLIRYIKKSRHEKWLRESISNIDKREEVKK